ncbi:ATP-binding cassette superfamily [Chrysochromulina tobinii]|uniref:ATP-binding cassette superfamily n=1 Tax=Chrysochromulina tobinii TaxID=1460289 RepID=A0A0M0JHG0_9EUKA|nr:ATP-binding cassette superfamily [Chrysochromulina tobinii]|eukprot:KOO25782.1 ATP-binding cassette superfamily [Chrysochromulina sp. CCMP291]
MDEPPSVACLRALMRARTAFPSGGDNDANGGEIDAGVADKADAAGSCVGLKIEKKPSTNPGRGARELTETLCIRLCRSRGGEGSLRGRSLSGGADFEAVFDGEARSAPPSKQVTLPEPLHEFSWEGLSYSAGALQVLRPSSGCIRPGLWAMIGPSGAGKSTLLGLLAGRKERGTSAGAVRLNGRRASARARRERIGYVTQDDVLPATSTVAEHLHFHAALRLPWLGGEARVQLVRHTMEALQLSKCADRLIGDGNGGYVRGLSGGERRRVSVATELMALAVGATSMLLLDEPLTGLDSANAALLSSALVALCPTSHTQTAPRSSHAHAAHAICDSERLLGAILFSGFVLNLPTLAKRAGAPPSAHPSLDGLLPAALPRYLSPLYYWHELLLSDELLQTTVHVHADTPGIKKPYDIGGEEVLMHLGYALNCSRLFGEPTMPCAYDLWAPAAAVAGLTALAVLLLAGCVRDPH